MMGVDIGIEIRASGVDHQFAQQSGAGELMQRIVNGGEGDAETSIKRFRMKLLGGYVPVARLIERLNRDDG